MGQKTSSKPITVTFGLATITLLVLVACNKEEEKGACVRVDGADAYCMNDETDGYCSGSGYTFHEGSSCSSVGYAYYCTPTDMRKSGGTIYGSARYLRSSTCDTKKGPRAEARGRAPARAAAVAALRRRRAARAAAAGRAARPSSVRPKTYRVVR